MQRLREGNIVQHFKREMVKNKNSMKYLYIIEAIATHTETNEKLVIYRALYKDDGKYGNFKVFARPYDIFMAEVNHDKYPQVKQKYIFEKIETQATFEKEKWGNCIDVKVKYFDKKIEKISKRNNGDWIDLRSAENVILHKGDFKLVSLGVGMILPYGYEAHIAPRSSTFKTWGIIQTNSVGIIDNSYSGNDDQWKLPIYATRDSIIKKGDRICQFRIVKKQPNFNIITVDSLNKENRGGFGSTGYN